MDAFTEVRTVKYYAGNYEVKKIHTTGTRDTVRERAAVTVLDLVRSCVARYGDTPLV